MIMQAYKLISNKTQALEGNSLRA